MLGSPFDKTPELGVDRPTQINLYFYHTPLSNLRSSYNFRFSVVIYSRLGVVEHGVRDSARRFKAGPDVFSDYRKRSQRMEKVEKSYILNRKNLLKGISNALSIVS